MKFRIYITFLFTNLLALFLGAHLMGEGTNSSWYLSLQLPPWMPPGWLFGVAWTTIMICFSVYMYQLWFRYDNKKEIVLLYLLQLILNIGWNPTFFNFHHDKLGLVIIISLWIVIAIFLVRYFKLLKGYNVLILPYFIWMLIANSLNLYISIYN